MALDLDEAIGIRIEIVGLGKTLKEFRDHNRKMENETKKSETKRKKAWTKMQQFIKKTLKNVRQEFGKTFKLMGRMASKTFKGMMRVAGRFFGFMSRWLKRLGLATAAATLGFGAMFEKRMKNVQAIMTITNMQFQQLTRNARSFTGLGVTPIKSAEAMYALASAGVEVTDMQGALQASLLLSTAAQGDQFMTTELIVTVLAEPHIQQDRVWQVILDGP